MPGDDRGRSGRRGQYADEDSLRHQWVVEAQRGINSETADNLDQDQKQVQRLDPYARERYFAVRDQQHAEDQVGNNGGQLREKRVEQPAGDHRDRQHPVLELLQYHAWYVM